jgi:large subunit ribosomal protein L1
MTKQKKKYLESAKLINSAREYPFREAIELAKQASHVKFDETVELHVRMGVNPRDSEQQVRGVALLPHGLGKQVSILVFAQGEAEKTATSAGADIVGSDDLIKKIEGGWLEFDTAIATPEMMGKVGKLGKILGRKGLMPNPKAGTVAPADDLPRIIEGARKGRVEFKLDRTAIIHVSIGKVSFDSNKLIENLTAVFEAIIRAKPVKAKGQYLKSAFLTTTMGPGIKLDLKTVPATFAI